MDIKKMIQKNIGFYCSTEVGFTKLLELLKNAGCTVPVTSDAWTTMNSDICILVSNNGKQVKCSSIRDAIMNSTHFIYNFETDFER